MGVLDKLKNALFEVEYVEVEEPPKKEKKEKKKKEKPKKIEKDNKPIAKKIVLPGKKEEKIEEIEEEELKDEDFEIRPKDETVKEEVHDSFKFMDDNDFKMDEEDYPIEEPKILSVKENEDKEESKKEKIVEEEPEEYNDIFDSHPDDYYSGRVSSKKESKPYGMDDSYSIPVHQYGTYEKEDKSYFRPSPIISPIYGILDKNYKKEDVKEKKEVRLTGYTRSNVSVDDIRNKAYGRRSQIEEEDEDEVKFDIEEEENVLVDLNDKAKPEVKELTVGDAVEYFQDLGLEYNVDYVDVSKDKKEKKKEEAVVEEQKEEKKPVVITEKTVEVTTEIPVEAIKEEKKVEEAPSDDGDNVDNDNLFDLIDSMYQDNE